MQYLLAPLRNKRKNSNTIYIPSYWGNMYSVILDYKNAYIHAL